MRKFLFIIVAAGTIIACNDAADSVVENQKDSLDSIATAKKVAIDSSAEARIDKIDSVTEVKKAALEGKDTLNNRDTSRRREK